MVLFEEFTKPAPSVSLMGSELFRTLGVGAINIVSLVGVSGTTITIIIIDVLHFHNKQFLKVNASQFHLAAMHLIFKIASIKVLAKLWD